MKEMKDDDCAGDLGFAADDDIRWLWWWFIEGDCVADDEEEEIHLSDNCLQSFLHTASHRHLGFPRHCHLHDDLHDLDVDLHDDDENRHLDFHDNGDWWLVLFLSVIWDEQICGLRWCTSNPNKLIFPLSQKYLETDSQTQAPLLDV